MEPAVGLTQGAAPSGEWQGSGVCAEPRPPQQSRIDLGAAQAQEDPSRSGRAAGASWQELCELVWGSICPGTAGLRPPTHTGFCEGKAPPFPVSVRWGVGHEVPVRDPRGAHLIGLWALPGMEGRPRSKDTLTSFGLCAWIRLVAGVEPREQACASAGTPGPRGHMAWAAVPLGCLPRARRSQRPRRPRRQVLWGGGTALPLLLRGACVRMAENRNRKRRSL